MLQKELDDLYLLKEEQINNGISTTQTDWQIKEVKAALWSILSLSQVKKSDDKKNYLDRVNCDEILNQFPEINRKLLQIEKQCNRAQSIKYPSVYHEDALDEISMNKIRFSKSCYSDQYRCTISYDWVITPLPNFISNITQINREEVWRNSWHWREPWRPQPSFHEIVKTLLKLIDESYS